MEITCNLKTKFFCTKRLMWEPLKFGTVLIKVVFCFDCCPHRCLFQCWRCSCSETEALTVFKLRLQNFPMRYICTVGAKRRPDIFFCWFYIKVQGWGWWLTVCLLCQVQRSSHLSQGSWLLLCFPPVSPRQNHFGTNLQCSTSARPHPTH